MQLVPLIVVNRTEKLPFAWSQNAPPPSDFVGWKTCLRNILITSSELCIDDLHTLPTDTIYEGVQAYGFLLEVLCGLHSEVFGETEVLGQFKERFFDPPQWLATVIESLLIDTKALRQKFLQNLGSQSYGSFLRKILPSDEPVVIVGSGNLTQSVLPYLLNPGRLIYVLTRNPSKSSRLLSNFQGVKFLNFDDPTPVSKSPFHLVVAAPVEASQIIEWTQKNCKTIVDFRETCQSNPIDHNKLTTLIDFFNTQKEIRSRNQNLKNVIQDFIVTQLLTQQHRLSRPIFRPFGWEDLCG